MQTITLRKKDFNNLKPLKLTKGTIHSEGDLYILMHQGKQKVVKTIFTLDKTYYYGKIKTLELLDSNACYLPDFLVIPDLLIKINSRVSSFTIPYIPGDNLSVFLKDKTNTFSEHIYYLKQIGEYLEQLRLLRASTPVKDFYLNDLQPSNFIVNPYTKRLSIIDLDSSKIGDNIAFSARYLTPFSLLSKVSKYQRNLKPNQPGYIIANEQSDIYCYIMSIIYYLTEDIASTFTIEEFNEYLNILNDSRIDKELISIIERIIKEDINLNPFMYLDTLTEQQVSTSRQLLSKKRN